MTQDAIYAACYRWMRKAWLEGADTGEDPEILQAIEAVYSEEEMDAAVIAELQKPENADLLSAALSDPQPKSMTEEQIPAEPAQAAWAQEGWASEAEYLSHLNCELRYSNAELRHVLRLLLTSPSDESKTFARQVLGDRE